MTYHHVISFFLFLNFVGNSFFSKAKKAAMTPLAPPPAPPTVPRLVEDVVPDDRDDPEIIQNTTTVSERPVLELQQTGGHLVCRLWL